MTNERCADCGALIAMVGVRHRCIKRPPSSPVVPPAAVTVTVEPAVSGAPSVADAGQAKIYKYRDADKWRAYMRDYMRGYRKRG